jgi:thiamine-phosphate pyrophosphorylase
MSTSPVVRIIDANFNRLAEGLRILEEIARLLLNDRTLTAQLKALRHNLIRADLSFNLELLQSRDSAKDVGEKLEVAGENKVQALPLIALANARRAQEALRVLEDLAKLSELCGKMDSAQFKSARFALYSIEKELVARLTRQEKAGLIKGLYVIVDLQFLGKRNPLEVTRQILEAGVKIIQLRSKNTDKNELLKLADEIQTLCRRSQSLFIMNDYLDIALAVKADGLHIGQSDFPAAIARQLLPIGALLGVSAATVEEAKAAEAAGADYLGIGAIYPTATKEKIDALGIERLSQMRLATKLPLVAIGGINSENIGDVMRAGADSACVISAVLGADNLQLAARQLIQIIEAKK